MIEFILAIRYLWKRRIAYLAIVTVALSVFVAFVVLTVMHGLVAGHKQKNHDWVGDCVISTDSLVGFAYYEPLVQHLRGLPDVEAVSCVVKSYGLYSMEGWDCSGGIQVIGLDPVQHSRTTGFARGLGQHRDHVEQVFIPASHPEAAGCVPGVASLPIFPRDTDGQAAHPSWLPNTHLDITCFPLTPRGALAKAGAGEANTKRFYVSDTSQSGLARVDGSTMYIALDEAQQLYGMTGPDPRINAIFIKFKPQVPLDRGTQAVAALWADYRRNNQDRPLAFLMDTVTVQDWKHYRRMTIAAVEKEQATLTVMFMLVAVTTVFIVFVVFYMIVSHKRRDIGILRSVGMSSQAIIRLYLGFSSLIGAGGALLGIGGGWIFLRHINDIEDWLNQQFHFQVWNRSLFIAIGDIPNQIDPVMVVLIGLCAVAACLVGAVIPAWQAARLRPIKTLQVNSL